MFFGSGSVVSAIISTIGEKSIAPVSGMILRIGARIGSSSALIARHTAATKSLCMLTTLKLISRLMTNCTMTSMTITEIR